MERRKTSHCWSCWSPKHRACTVEGKWPRWSNPNRWQKTPPPMPTHERTWGFFSTVLANGWLDRRCRSSVPSTQVRSSIFVGASEASCSIERTSWRTRRSRPCLTRRRQTASLRQSRSRRGHPQQSSRRWRQIPHREILRWQRVSGTVAPSTEQSMHWGQAASHLHRVLTRIVALLGGQCGFLPHPVWVGLSRTTEAEVHQITICHQNDRLQNHLEATNRHWTGNCIADRFFCACS